MTTAREKYLTEHTKEIAKQLKIANLLKIYEILQLDALSNSGKYYQQAMELLDT